MEALMTDRDLYIGAAIILLFAAAGGAIGILLAVQLSRTQPGNVAAGFGLGMGGVAAGAVAGLSVAALRQRVRQ